MWCTEETVSNVVPVLKKVGVPLDFVGDGSVLTAPAAHNLNVLNPAVPLGADALSYVIYCRVGSR